MVRRFGKRVLGMTMLLWLGEAVRAADSPVPLSVCESIQRGPAIRGRTVRVTGVLERTPGGLLLTDESGGHVTIDGTEIQCVLAVDSADGKSDAIGRKLRDVASVIRLGKRPGFAPLLFTIEGVVESDRDRAISVGTPRTRPRVGYGHLAWWPGLVSVTDIVSVTLRYARPGR